jgi:hypothetical protein
MTTNPDPDPGHPSHPHRSVHRDHRNWPAPTFQPEGGPAAPTTGDTGSDRADDNPFSWDNQFSWDNDAGDPWAFKDPRRNQTAIAYTDNDTETLIREAVETLTIYRAPMGLGDAGATVSVLVSLAAEADTQLWEAVADAHDQGYTWGEIADRLATSVTTARRRYAAYTNWRNTQPLKPD